LGTDNLVISTDADQMTAVNNKFDMISDTVSNAHDINPSIFSLSLNGNLDLVGFLGNLDEPPLNTISLVMRHK
jgi:uncharacterized zinc-type alcohol dehydrogenase-like protein